MLIVIRKTGNGTNLSCVCCVIFNGNKDCMYIARVCTCMVLIDYIRLID